jgi:hypothetical protein
LNWQEVASDDQQQLNHILIAVSMDVRIPAFDLGAKFK